MAYLCRRHLCLVELPIHRAWPKNADDVESEHAFVEHGRVIELWANRDDLGMAKQLGWIPPTPTYLFKMARAKRHARRS